MKYFIIFSFFLLPLNAVAQLTPEKVHEKVSGAVVVINMYDDLGNWMHRGSGVLVDSSGTIWTNFHLFDKNYSFEIKNEYKTFDSCMIIGADPEKDVLILKVSGGIDNFIRPDTNRTRKKGARVYAYGNPESKLLTFSDGIISNFTDAFYNGQTYIQFTASISPGSSGGALINEFGELIGITNSTLDKDNAQNINFAVQVEDFYKTVIFDDTSSSHLFNYCVAHQLEGEGMFYEALLLFEDYNKYFPYNSHTYNKRGRCSLQLGKYNKAVDLFSKAIELDNTISGYFRDRGYAKMMDSNYVGAREDLEYSLRLKPDDGYSLSYLAILESDILGNNSEALELCNSAIKIDSFDPFHYRVKGNVYLSMKDTNSALSCFNDALFADSLNTDALYLVADLSLKLRYFKDAISAYSTILRVGEYAESDPKIYYNRGIAFRNQNKLQKAIEDLKESLSLDPVSFNTLIALGYCYLESDEYDSGYNLIKKAFKKNRSLESFLAMAIAKYILKEFDESNEYVLKAVKLYPNLNKGMDEIRRMNHWRTFYWNSNELKILDNLFTENGINNSIKDKGKRKDNRSGKPSPAK